MRFYLFDRVIDFIPGVSSIGIKNISSEEDFLIDHYDRLPVMPSPLIVEALAQLGGWTITTSNDYKHLAVMVMIKDIEITGNAVPGDQLILKVKLENINEFGATISAEAEVNESTVLKIGSLTYVLYELPAKDREEVEIKYKKFNRAITAQERKL